MPVTWIEYQGKKILYADHRGLKNEDALLANVDLQAQYVRASSEKVLMLADFRNTYIGSKFLERAKSYGTRHESKLAKHAMIGITGIKRILLNAYILFTGDPVKTFDDEESAKKYLVEE